jgi:PhnB protein
MASDSQPGQDVTDGNGNHISIACNDEEQAEQYFNNLVAGGTVIMPYEKTFWGAKFGMCIDKYGKSWMVNCQLDES